MVQGGLDSFTILSKLRANVCGIVALSVLRDWVFSLLSRGGRLLSDCSHVEKQTNTRS
jgi:hypothetical protein